MLLEAEDLAAEVPSGLVVADDDLGRQGSELAPAPTSDGVPTSAGLTYCAAAGMLAAGAIASVAWTIFLGWVVAKSLARI
jgi:hypothetical protein